MIRLPVTVVLAAVMLLGLVMGGPAHAVQPDESDSDDTGLHLLREAAVAGRARGYSGTQYVTAWGRSAAVSSVLEVRNVPGEGLTVHAQPSGLLQRVDPGTPAGGMSTPSETMLEVLARNYRVVAVGEGASAAGRPASSTPCGPTARSPPATGSTRPGGRCCAGSSSTAAAGSSTPAPSST